jgi:protocatechuate 3,4-dioxygenase beta subunit
MMETQNSKLKNQKFVFFACVVLIFGLGVLFFNFQKDDSSDEITTRTENQVSFTSPTDCTGEVIPRLTEGPYYKAGSPAKTNIIDGSPGEKMTLTGYVFDENCKPIEGAWIDFWQADGEGNYDNVGFKLRGHQFTDKEGKYFLETVIPGEYPGRTPHIHLKIRANESSQTITSQLFMPGAVQNQTDSIFNEALIMHVSNTSGDATATYNFVIPRN